MSELSPEELKQRLVRFYDRYGKDLEQIKSLLEIRLSQLALAYTIDNKLPPEAVRITARVKGLGSFLKKLEKKGWPQFYYPTDIVNDLIGARVVCWFLDDCHGFMKLINSSHHLKLDSDVEDYIKEPKRSGYRSIHLVGSVAYDSVDRGEDKEIVIAPREMKCEIQIRTKLQDAWGDVTHEFHYKAKSSGVENNDLEGFLSDISDRLATEDLTLIKFRKAYQRLAEDKINNKTRQGFVVEQEKELQHKYFLSPPFVNLESALQKSRQLGLPLFVVIYDSSHPKKSKLEYSLGYFLEYQTTKKIVDKKFVAALVDWSDPAVKKLVPESDPLENCRLVIITPDGKTVYSEGVYANPDEGLKIVQALISAHDVQKW
ncbi:hypothetical protein HX810_25500 [Pseudomonas salomonii]|uniref:RelA/SpoT domain-containing protein n=1 Tax=Pseudomonas salomonii TaxID=191391 RepID=A0A7Y8GJ46_9PSED|nr:MULTISPECIES: hypothetical protein [Pseudomonas]NWF11036.1 hypothetical protein [Pseudomonas salomonii]CRM65452.1 GTP pyrophosphokinase YwaC [Pseudomonas sp. 58 R 3]